jgi:hypothetical protein
MGGTKLDSTERKQRRPVIGAFVDHLCGRTVGASTATIVSSSIASRRSTPDCS